jgi:hypothetical protein
MPSDHDQEKVAQNPQDPASIAVPGTTTPTSERRSFFGRNSASNGHDVEEAVEDDNEDKGKPTRWGMGDLNDPHTHEVPGKIALFMDMAASTA